MNGIEFIIDTNAILYSINDNPCMAEYLDSEFGISIITEMELLSFRNITEEEENVIRRIVEKCEYFSLTKAIKEKAIVIRRKYGTKLPDSIVAATAICNNVPLITADKGFLKIKELNLILLEPTA